MPSRWQWCSLLIAGLSSVGVGRHAVAGSKSQGLPKVVASPRSLLGLSWRAETEQHRFGVYEWRFSGDVVGDPSRCARMVLFLDETKDPANVLAKVSFSEFRHELNDVYIATVPDPERDALLFAFVRSNSDRTRVSLYKVAANHDGPRLKMSAITDQMWRSLQDTKPWAEIALSLWTADLDWTGEVAVRLSTVGREIYVDLLCWRSLRLALDTKSMEWRLVSPASLELKKGWDASYYFRGASAGYYIVKPGASIRELR